MAVLSSLGSKGGKEISKADPSPQPSPKGEGGFKKKRREKDQGFKYVIRKTKPGMV
jgi:hypothetical protein